MSRFVCPKGDHALKVVRIMKMLVKFKPKPESAMMVAQKQHSKVQRRSQGSAPEAPETSVTGMAPVSDPDVILCKLFIVIFLRTCDEGFWQLLSRPNPVDVDADPGCVDKLLDMLALGTAKLRVSGLAPCAVTRVTNEW